MRVVPFTLMQAREVAGPPGGETGALVASRAWSAREKEQG